MLLRRCSSNIARRFGLPTRRLQRHGAKPGSALLTDFGKEGKSETVIPRFNPETLAEKIGTAKASIRFLMKRFRESGFLTNSRNGQQIPSSIFTTILDDQLLCLNPAIKAPRQR